MGSTFGCSPTDLDTGTGTAVATPSALPAVALAGTTAPVGTVVTVSTRDGTDLEAFTTAPEPPSSRLAYHRLLGPEMFNTGVGFYLTHTVGWDLRAGQLLITPTV